MFEAVELGRKVSKAQFAEQVPALRTELLAAQRGAERAQVPVILVIAGVEGAGKGYVVNRLNEWLDSRGVRTHAFWDETDEERERPRYWRFWRTLPPRGTVAVLFGAWYSEVIDAHVAGRLDDNALERRLGRVNALERMLTDDGALIVKFWFHLSREEQAKRFKQFAKRGSRRRGLNRHEKHYAKHYDEFIRSAERAIRLTDGACPWHLIEANDRRYRDLTMGRALLTAMQRRLGTPAAPPPAAPATAEIAEDHDAAPLTVLDHIDLARRADEGSYHARLRDYQDELNRLTWRAWEMRRSTVAVFEGWDAAGKGGAIRRATAQIDARLYNVISVGAPTDEERAHHYLWRFWRHLPRAGYVTLYDRSWYGRVLVERVEGYAGRDEWSRAYREINDFEEQLCEHGIALAKFWIHIDPDEQLRRFHLRERTPWKRHKIGPEDWRNRQRWDEYKLAVNDMVEHTSTTHAPWSLIAGNDKKFARLEILRQLCAHMQALVD